ncbi:hypothetical protein L208DRAFT_1332311, partial [Tricholoma matsutake]
NHQKECILTESALIKVYKNMCHQLEKIFCLDHKTTQHLPPTMKLTFKRLGTYMQKHEANIYKPGRTTNYTIPDVMSKGMHVMMTPKLSMGIPDGADVEDEDNANQMDVEDWGLPDEMEVEDDGSLDV